MRSVVSPSFQKTGKVRGAERERAFGFNYLPRSYYGINVGDEEGYTRETEALGHVRHDASIDPRRLYNYGEDPLGLKDRATKASTDVSEQINIMERLIKEAGFAGYWGGNSGGPVAVIYEALRPERVSDESGDLDFNDTRIEFADFSSFSELMDRQPDRDIDTLYGVAPTWQENLSANGKDIAGQFGADFIDPGIKAKETTAEKLKRKGYASTAQLTDVVRGGFAIDLPEQADAIVDELRRRFNIFDENWGANSSGYFDRKVLVSFMDGTVGEVQIWPREMLEAKERGGGHKLYEEQRTLKYTDPRYQELAAEMRALYATALSKSDPEWAQILAASLGQGLSLQPAPVGGASDTASVATSGGGSSAPNAEKNASDPIQNPLSRTSNALTGTQPRAGSDNQAVSPSSDMMAGRPSQSTSFTGTSNQNVGTPTENSTAAQSDNRARPSFAFEAKRAPGIAAAPGAEVKPTSLNDVADLIRSTMDVVVRQGRISAGGKVVGTHNKKTGVIRVRNRADVQTLLHEVAHSINETEAGTVNRLFTKHAAEMRRVYEQLYPADVGDPDQQLREGFAEWFRIYSTRNDGVAARIAPGFTTDFEAWMKSERPELGEGIQTIRDAYIAHNQNTSLGVVRGMVVSAKEPTVGKRVMREVREGTLFSSARAAAHKAYTSVFDGLHPVKQAMEELRRIYGENFGKMIDLSPLKDPYKLARNAVSAYSAGHVDIMHGVHGYQNIAAGPTSRSLRDVIMEAHGYKAGSFKSWKPETIQAFGEYLVARRAVFEYERYHAFEIPNEPVEATEADVQQAVIDLETQFPAFAAAAQGVYEFTGALWKKKYDAGLITKDQYEAGLAIRDYVPFMRDMTDKEPIIGGGASGSKTGKSKVFKRFKGSNRKIINPLESLMREAYETAMIIARNDAYRAVADLGETAGYGSGSIVEKIPSMQSEKVTLTASDVGKITDKMANNLALSGKDRDAATMKLLVEEVMTEDMTVELWKMGEINEKGEPIIYVWRKGKREAYRLADGDFGKDLYEALTGIGNEQSNWIVNLAAMPSTALRAGITAHPAFLFANYIRDQMSAWILTDVGYVPFLTGAKGVIEEVRQKETARMYNAAMGAMGGTNVSSLDNARVKRDLAALERKGYIAQHTDSFAGIVAMTELTETGTRLGIFQKAFAKSKKDGLTDEEALVEAAYVSRDYIDFSRHGSKMLAARRLIPFLNAQLQGLDKMTRTLGGVKNLRRALGIRMKNANNLPLTKNEKADLNNAIKAWTKMSALAVLSLALSQLYADDPEYEEISDYLRATHWMVKAGPGEWIAIPKPFELAILANMTERAYEGVVKKDPTAGERFLAGLYQNVTPPFQIPIVQTGYEIALNKDTFTGREIVPVWQQGLPPELQFSAYTSEFAKATGKSVGISPHIIDHVITSFGATWGRDFLNASNQTNRSRPEPGWDDSFITQRFFRDYSRGATSSIAFWDTIGRTNGSLQKAYTGYREYSDAGKYTEAENYLSNLGDDERAFAYLNHGFEAEIKRLHPARRASDVYEVLSGIKKELYLDELTVEATGEKIVLPRTTKRQLEDAINELGLREQRNAMVVLQQPGWANKTILPTQPLFEVIQSINPAVAEELEARTKLKSGKAKIYPFDGVAAAWPELKRRLLEGREEAVVIDLLGEAKFGGEGLFTSGGYQSKDAAIGNTAAPLNPFEGLQ